MGKMKYVSLFEEFNSNSSSDISRYTYYDIRDYEKVGSGVVTFYPNKKGSRDSFTLCDSSDIARMKDILDRNDISYRNIVFGPDYHNGKRDPMSATVILDKEDEERLRKIISDGPWFSFSYNQ